MTSSDTHKILACDMRPVNAPGEDEEWVYIVPEADLKQLVEQLQAALLQIEFLEERHEALGKTYDGLHGRLDEFSQSADFHRRENERLIEQLEAAQKVIDAARAVDAVRHSKRPVHGLNQSVALRLALDELDASYPASVPRNDPRSELKEQEEHTFPAKERQ